MSALHNWRANGLRNCIKVMAGGAPVDAAFADKIAADGYAMNAAEAVNLARAFMVHLG
jgi:methanogenic corrinoid protein MtbC1